MTDEILVISNDVVPGQGIPVAAPGLRAAGLATGLRRHGHPVSLVVDDRVLARAAQGPVPTPLPRGAMVAEPRRFGDLVRARRPRAVVMTNSNHIDALDGIEDVPLVYDFFAPKVLEAQQQPPGAGRDRAVATLRSRKLRALGRAQAVIVNGARKVPYAQEWLARAGNAAAADRVAVVNMPLPGSSARPYSQGPLHVIVAGYVQPWSRPGRWTEVLEPFLRDGSLVLHLLVTSHWGSRKRKESLPEEFAALKRLEGVVSHGLLEYDDFRALLSRCHLAIDLFERNPERELAMVTRTAVALSCGLPVLHVPFTETGDLIRDHGAGWLVESDDLDGIRQALESAIADLGELARRRQGAEEVARTVLEPAIATEPLHRLLEELR